MIRPICGLFAMPIDEASVPGVWIRQPGIRLFADAAGGVTDPVMIVEHGIE